MVDCKVHVAKGAGGIIPHVKDTVAILITWIQWYNETSLVGYACQPVHSIKVHISLAEETNGFHMNNEDSAVVGVAIGPYQRKPLLLIEILAHELAHALACPMRPQRVEWMLLPHDERPHEVYAHEVARWVCDMINDVDAETRTSDELQFPKLEVDE